MLRSARETVTDPDAVCTAIADRLPRGSPTAWPLPGSGEPVETLPGARASFPLPRASNYAVLGVVPAEQGRRRGAARDDVVCSRTNNPGTGISRPGARPKDRASSGIAARSTRLWLTPVPPRAADKSG